MVRVKQPQSAIRRGQAAIRGGKGVQKKEKSTTNQNATPSTEGPSQRTTRKRSRPRRGTRVLQDIRKLQKSTSTLIPRAAFCRVVREIVNDHFGIGEYRIQLKALLALQEAAEAYMTCLFEDMQFVAIHAKRVTIMPRDLHLVQKLRKPFEKSR
uniref:Histone domain-containing protein n=1 Tax=Steinernema glaseri TaxID=37863 RepID=A0A1I7Y2Z5_9BILA